MYWFLLQGHGLSQLAIFQDRDRDRDRDLVVIDLTILRFSGLS